MKKRHQGFFALLFAGLFLLLLVQTADAASWWTQKYVRYSATAGETLTTGDVVCIKGSDGEAYKADADDSSLRPAVGVIDKGGASGSTVEIVVDGVISGMTAKSPGATLYLATTAGAFTTTAPTNEQTIGWVLPGTAGSSSSTTYFIRVEAKKSPSAGY
ncbi:MAG: DUF2190 family protein [Syntrophaceae bacterium]|nr:DUF2190 family protein [Syntrophaceae bacterium]